MGSEEKRTTYLINTEVIIFKVSGQPEEEKKEQKTRKVMSWSLRRGTWDSEEQGYLWLGCKWLPLMLWIATTFNGIAPSKGLRIYILESEKSGKICTLTSDTDMGWCSEAWVLGLNPGCSVYFITLPIPLSIWRGRGTLVCKSLCENHLLFFPQGDTMRSKDIILLRISCLVFVPFALKWGALRFHLF